MKSRKCVLAVRKESLEVKLKMTKLLTNELDYETMKRRLKNIFNDDYYSLCGTASVYHKLTKEDAELLLKLQSERRLEDGKMILPEYVVVEKVN